MTKIKLLVKGGSATPGPPVGAILGSKGLNARNFCVKFNEMTQNMKGKLLRVHITVSPDKKMDIEIKGPPTSMLIKEKAKIEKGSSEPNRNKVGELTHKDIEEIVKETGDSLNGFTKEAKMRIVMGQARNMGIKLPN